MRWAEIAYSVRRVGEYSSSLRDLKDCTNHKGAGCIHSMYDYIELFFMTPLYIFKQFIKNINFN